MNDQHNYKGPTVPKPETLPNPPPSSSAESSCSGSVSRAEAKELIFGMCYAIQTLEQEWNELQNLIGCSIEHSFGESVWGVAQKLIESTSAAVGDKDKTLDWFVWECHFGTNRRNTPCRVGKWFQLKTFQHCLRCLATR